MYLVLDTNVLVSALLSPASPPARVLAWVLSGEITLCTDARILGEYADVLRRPEFPFDRVRIDEVLGFIRRASLPVQGVASPISGPDPDDMAFVEVCLAGPAEVIVTGNLKHYPPAMCRRIRVMNPSDFVSSFLRRKTES